MQVALTELDALARETLARAGKGSARATVIFLSGELGAGKTTFTQALARALGVTEPVVSPTYVLMKSYALAGQRWEKLVHLDLYRLEKPEELHALKLESVFADPTALLVVEWPERAHGALPSPDLALSFSSEGAGDSERYIEVHEGQ